MPKTTQITSFITKIDLLGQKHTFTFKTLTGKFQTRIGGCITVLLSLVIAAVFPLILLQYTDKSSPIVTTSEESRPSHTIHNLYENQLITPLFFNLGGLNFLKEIDQFVTVKGFSVEMELNNQTGGYDQVSVQEVEYKRCVDLNDSLVNNSVQLFAKAASHLNDHLFCPDFGRGLTESSQIFTREKSTKIRRFFVKVFPCSHRDPSQCAPAELMAHFTVSWGINNLVLNSSRVEKPIENFLRLDITHLDFSQKQFIDLITTDYQLVDHNSGLMSSKKELNFVALSRKSVDSISRDPSISRCNEKDLVLNNDERCPEYFSFQYDQGPDQVVVSRQYKRLVEIIAEFGGLLKLLTVATFLYSVYNLKVRRLFFKKEILSPSKENQKEAADLSSSLNNLNKKIDPRSRIVGGDEPDTGVELLKERISATDFVKKMNLVEVLTESMIIQESDKILIPLALSRAKLLFQEKLTKGSEGIQKNIRAKNQATKSTSGVDQTQEPAQG